MASTHTPRSTASGRNLLLLIAALLACALAVPALAAPFTGGTATLKSDLLAIITPFAGIALIGVGFVCWIGKISWVWLAGLIVGIVLVFGNDQVVSWIRGMFSV